MSSVSAKRRGEKRNGRPLLLLGAWTILVAVLFCACKNPVIPEPIAKDKELGFLATLGDVPLFGPDPENSGNDIAIFDDDSVGAPDVLRIIQDDGSEIVNLYFEADNSEPDNPGDDPTPRRGNLYSYAIGQAASDDGGFTFRDRRVLLLARTLDPNDPQGLGQLGFAIDDSYPWKTLPPAPNDFAYDSFGVQNPFVRIFVNEKKYLYYSGPGVWEQREGVVDGLITVPPAIGRTIVAGEGVSAENPSEGTLWPNGDPVVEANKIFNADTLGNVSSVFHPELPPVDRAYPVTAAEYMCKGIKAFGTCTDEELDALRADLTDNVDELTTLKREYLDYLDDRDAVIFQIRDDQRDLDEVQDELSRTDPDSLRYSELSEREDALLIELDELQDELAVVNARINPDTEVHPEVNRIVRPDFMTNLSMNIADPDLLISSGGTEISKGSGLFPWESGGISSPFLIEDPSHPGRMLVYYTCTEELARNTDTSSDDYGKSTFRPRICVGEELISPDGRPYVRRILFAPTRYQNQDTRQKLSSAEIFIEAFWLAMMTHTSKAVEEGFRPEVRYIDNTGYVPYALPGAPSLNLPNNIVVGYNNAERFLGVLQDFDAHGTKDPTLSYSQSVTGRWQWRMWYVGINNNGAERICLTGSWEGLDWDADGVLGEDDVTSGFRGVNPIIYQARQAASPTTVYDRYIDEFMRVYYESNEGINLATTVDVQDDIPPDIEFVRPSGDDLVIKQYGNSVRPDLKDDITIDLAFEDNGGSGLSEEKFSITAVVRMTKSSDPDKIGTTLTGLRATANNQQLNITSNSDFSDAFPFFTMGDSDTATVSLTLQNVSINPVLALDEEAEITFEARIFDRADNGPSIDTVTVLVINPSSANE